jgi:2'-5' RNA ligase
MNFLQFSDKERRYDYSSLMVELPEHLTDNIISWGFDHVPDETLFNSEDFLFGREDDIHITVIYGIHTSNVKQVSKNFIDEKQIDCTLGKISLFTKNKNFDVLVIDVFSEGLHKLNSRMKSSLLVTQNHAFYVPHVTIAYLKKGTGNKYVGDDTFNGERFNIDKVFFSSKTGKKTPISLEAT